MEVEGLNTEFVDFKLVANRWGKVISFVESASTFTKGVTIEARGGIVLSSSLTVQTQPTSITGTAGGILTIMTGEKLTTSNQALLITADSVSLLCTPTDYM